MSKDRQYKSWTNEEDLFLQDNYKKMNDTQLCDALKRTKSSIRQRRNILGFTRHDSTQKKQYALYKGENLLRIGTINEIAKAEGVKPETIRFYKNPSYKKRRENGKSYREVVCLDE